MNLRSASAHQDKVARIQESIRSLTILLEGAVDEQGVNRAQLSCLIADVTAILPAIDAQFERLNEKNRDEARQLGHCIERAKALNQNLVSPSELDMMLGLNLGVLNADEAIDFSFVNELKAKFLAIEEEKKAREVLLPKLKASIEEQLLLLEEKKAILSQLAEAEKILASLPSSMRRKVSALKNSISSSALVTSSLSQTFSNYQAKLKICQELERRVEVATESLARNVDRFNQNNASLDDILLHNINDDAIVDSALQLDEPISGWRLS